MATLHHPASSKYFSPPTVRQGRRYWRLGGDSRAQTCLTDRSQGIFGCHSYTHLFWAHLTPADKNLPPPATADSQLLALPPGQPFAQVRCRSFGLLAAVQDELLRFRCHLWEYQGFYCYICLRSKLEILLQREPRARRPVALLASGFCELVVFR